MNRLLMHELGILDESITQAGQTIQKLLNERIGKNTEYIVLVVSKLIYFIDN